MKQEIVSAFCKIACAEMPTPLLKGSPVDSERIDGMFSPLERYWLGIEKPVFHDVSTHRRALQGPASSRQIVRAIMSVQFGESLRRRINGESTLELYSDRIRIGTRGSLLARTQTDWTADSLRALHPGIDVEIVVIQTTGDVRRDVPFTQVGTKGMFVKEIEQALLERRIDLGVHSLKDMPSELPEGLELICIPLREDPLDALLSIRYADLNALPPGARVGTSSLRRQAQIRRYRPDLQIVELRGNLDTRLRRLDAGDYDAILLACAGLNRLGLSERITERLAVEVCVPAVGQGALALEARYDDARLRELTAPLHDAETSAAIEAERGFQSGLAGGCSLPAGAFARVYGDQVELRALIASPDGARALADHAIGPRADAHGLGRALADTLLARGGHDLLKGL